ncbi:MAG TPA: phenylalanine--tRNA ligase beta subunit-related protein [Thermoanaerobaculia bacterium]
MAHSVEVDPRIWELRPDFVVTVVRARGLSNGPSDDASTALLRRAEQSARAALNGAEPATLPHIAAWRDAYRAFGAKAQRTPCSAEALMKRAIEEDGLPSINRIVDLYNAVSVEFALPVGGEDLGRYAGAPRLTIAVGDEPFDTFRSGEPVIEHPAPGEVVWVDDEGVTCRRWNWRQCARTRLTEASADAFFVLERLEPLPLATLAEAAETLVNGLRDLGRPRELKSWTLSSPR